MYTYVHVYIHIYIYIYVYIYVLLYPPDPMNHVKVFKGWPHRCVLWKLVPTILVRRK